MSKAIFVEIGCWLMIVGILAIGAAYGLMGADLAFLTPREVLGQMTSLARDMIVFGVMIVAYQRLGGLGQQKPN